eukprot:TRINITY_DN31883_c0_g1_i1.p1 TRINITY_DN31883_c0_g1~~TRINITY_DN31883_c0_g1_i1.p1  ORF type:complete len:480 (-),score=47.19 TRINITY_DN31883_c0_g1_i1:181-1590(-)
MAPLAVAKRILQRIQAEKGHQFAEHLILPYGVLSLKAAGGKSSETSIGVAISPHCVLDCGKIARPPYNVLPACMAERNLDALLQSGKPVWKDVRKKIKGFLASVASDDSSVVEHDDSDGIFLAGSDIDQLHLPCTVGDYTDFFTSPQHACRGNWERLRPNWKSLPVGYHGRSSTVIAGGSWASFDKGSAAEADVVATRAQIHRPTGQYIDADGRLVFAPSRRLDYEVEVGCILGGAENPVGSAVNSFAEAEARIFGFVILNDLSARDIQYWEMAPLGPFLGKSFGSIVSPWIVPKEAMDEQCRRSPRNLSARYPEELKKSLELDESGRSSLVPEYLQVPSEEFDYEYDAPIEVGVRLDSSFYSIAKTNLSAMHWTWEQLVLHHASNGCNLRPGDLLGSGTLSVISSDPGNYGCLQESTYEGNKRRRLKASDDRTIDRMYLEDGDTCVMRGNMFGECAVEILKARSKTLQ